MYSNYKVGFFRLTIVISCILFIIALIIYIPKLVWELNRMNYWKSYEKKVIEFDKKTESIRKEKTKPITPLSVILKNPKFLYDLDYQEKNEIKNDYWISVINNSQGYLNFSKHKKENLLQDYYDIDFNYYYQVKYKVKNIRRYIFVISLIPTLVWTLYFFIKLIIIKYIISGFKLKK